MAKKTAKTASKNSPSQRSKAKDVLFNGKPVIKIKAQKRVNGKIQSFGLAAYKEQSAASKPDLFATDQAGRFVTWDEVDS